MDNDFKYWMIFLGVGVMCLTVYGVADRWLEHMETAEAMKAGYEQRVENGQTVWGKLHHEASQTSEAE